MYMAGKLHLNVVAALLEPVVLLGPPVVHALPDQRQDVFMTLRKEQTSSQRVHDSLAATLTVVSAAAAAGVVVEQLHDGAQTFDVLLQREETTQKQVFKHVKERRIDATDQIDVLFRELEWRAFEVQVEAWRV